MPQMKKPQMKQSERHETKLLKNNLIDFKNQIEQSPRPYKKPDLARRNHCGISTIINSGVRKRIRQKTNVASNEPIIS